MTEHERYKQAFASLDTRVTPAQIRALAEAGKGETTMKHRRPLRIAMIAALIALLLTGTVTAAGIRGGWLLPVLSNIGVDSALLEKVMHPAISAEVGNERWTVDELLIEGNVIVMQYTRESLDGSPIQPTAEDADWQLYLMDGNGMALSDISSSSTSRAEDGNTRSRLTELRCFEFYLNGEEPDWENTSLMLYLAGTSLFPKLMFTAPAGTPVYKNAVLENGTPVRIGRFTLELDLTAMTRSMDADVSLVLDDGIVIPCTGGSMGVASPGGGLEPGYTTQFTLPQVIDPNTVTAIQIDGVTMPIS